SLLRAGLLSPHHRPDRRSPLRRAAPHGDLRSYPCARSETCAQGRGALTACTHTDLCCARDSCPRTTDRTAGLLFGARPLMETYRRTPVRGRRPAHRGGRAPVRRSPTSHRGTGRHPPLPATRRSAIMQSPYKAVPACLPWWSASTRTPTSSTPTSSTAP